MVHNVNKSLAYALDVIVINVDDILLHVKCTKWYAIAFACGQEVNK